MSGSFDPSASYVPAGLRKAAREAVSLGWTAKKSGREGWFIRSPKGTQKFYVPITCKDADALSRKLRSLVNKAYLSEGGGLLPDFGAEPGAIAHLVGLQDKVMELGVSINQGPDPTLTCRDCDGEWVEIEGFIAHQDACRERVRARLAAEQAKEVPEEQGEADRPSDGVQQDVTDSTKPGHSGIISTKEETPLATTSSTPAPKPGPKTTRNPETGRKQGYKWTQVNGRGNPLHEIIYTAVRMNRRLRDETDSQWTRRLADFIESEGLLGKLPDATPEGQAAYMINQIKDVIWPNGMPVDQDPEEIEQYQQEIATKNEEIEGLKKEVGTLKEFLGTMNSLAQEMNTKEVKRDG